MKEIWVGFEKWVDKNTEFDFVLTSYTVKYVKIHSHMLTLDVVFYLNTFSERMFVMMSCIYCDLIIT